MESTVVAFTAGSFSQPMSTGLQLLRDLPKLRLHASDSPPPLGFTASAPPTTAVRPEDHRDDEEECRTPTSEESRIPAVLTCPPAPKKRRPAPSCKRKLEFFEILNRTGIDEIFRPVAERTASAELPKRKRLSKRIIA